MRCRWQSNIYLWYFGRSSVVLDVKMNKYCKIKNDMMHNRRKSTCLALEMFYMPLCDDCEVDEFWSCVGSIFRGFRRSVAQALIFFQHIHTHSETCISIYEDEIKDIRPDIVSYTITTRDHYNYVEGVIRMGVCV